MAHTLELPAVLTNDQQMRVLEIVGLGSAPKFLSQSYSLGGYSGFEIGLSAESINTQEISGFGDRSVPQTKLSTFPTLSIGKGLFNSSDFFFHFSPNVLNSGLTKYGLTYRWTFYEALFLPLNFSLIGHGGSTNLNNHLVTRNLSADIMIGLSIDDLSFFASGGWINSSGRFTGGTNGITESLNEEFRKTGTTHFNFGATYNFQPFFIGLGIDRYIEETYTFKSGFIF